MTLIGHERYLSLGRVCGAVALAAHGLFTKSPKAEYHLTIKNEVPRLRMCDSRSRFCSLLISTSVTLSSKHYFGDQHYTICGMLIIFTAIIFK